MKSLASGAVAGGAGALVAGRYVSKGVTSDLASDIATKTVGGGDAACLSALA
ncbi:hypothetical protein SAMN05428945_1550 [Streptomyces sp. 2224.1]|uniref:hypothetical protein n=1 Tax=unclassified Streptomyces TaxID=2593676 RepID=UPI00089A7FC6|nr:MULTISPECIES: hypothetical protein [unclassified Streptomyces]SEB92570.1 hypothetical protein SAMN05428945_1550 [Streptomyces sp. 2224.1]SEE68418.1 hypothetical protein SAMN05428954_3477 [Streptomyces sp. 2112.3]